MLKWRFIKRQIGSIVKRLSYIISMDKAFPRQGAVWRCYGFTKTHFWGVSLTSCAFVIAGMLFAAYSIIAPEEDAVRILLLAVCCLLFACATVLFSIMTLLFYLGSALKNEDQKPVA